MAQSELNARIVKMAVLPFYNWALFLKGLFYYKIQTVGQDFYNFFASLFTLQCGKSDIYRWIGATTARSDGVAPARILAQHDASDGSDPGRLLVLAHHVLGPGSRAHARRPMQRRRRWDGPLQRPLSAAPVPQRSTSDLTTQAVPWKNPHDWPPAPSVVGCCWWKPWSIPLRPTHRDVHWIHLIREFQLYLTCTLFVSI